MSIHSNQSSLFIIISFAFAMLLTVVPLPESMIYFRPQWSVLFVLYWVLTLPDKFGVITAFIVGLFFDTLTGTLLGQHALSLSIISYIALLIHQRLRVSPLWQQSFTIFILLLVDSFIARWVLSIDDRPIHEISYWLTPVIGAVLWPWLYIVMSDLRNRAHKR